MLATKMWSIKPAVASSWWAIPGQTCVGAYQAKGSASLAASYVNLKKPGTNDLYLQTDPAPGWNTTVGWIWTGAQALWTGFTPTVNSWFVVRFSSAIPPVALGGFASGVGRFCIIIETDRVRYEWGTIDAPAYPVITTGVLAVTSTGGWRNGISDIAYSAILQSMYEFAIGKKTAGVAYWMTGNIQAVAVYDSLPAAGDVTTVSTAIAAL